MSQIISTALPSTAFLGSYQDQTGTYTDCFQTTVAKHVPLEDFINAFFNTWLFKLERRILSLALRKPSSDQDIAKLAKGTSNTMAAWRTEQRDDDQLLLEVPNTPIRTWLMRCSDGDQTHLYFGSAVLPSIKGKDGSMKLGHSFFVLLGFHKLYARALLYAAKRALR